MFAVGLVLVCGFLRYSVVLCRYLGLICLFRFHACYGTCVIVGHSAFNAVLIDLKGFLFDPLLDPYFVLLCCISFNCFTHFFSSFLFFEVSDTFFQFRIIKAGLLRNALTL